MYYPYYPGPPTAPTPSQVAATSLNKPCVKHLKLCKRAVEQGWPDDYRDDGIGVDYEGIGADGHNDDDDDDDDDDDNDDDNDDETLKMHCRPLSLAGGTPMTDSY